MKSKPKIAVSACLLGHLVRYDGGHRKVSWIIEELSHIAEIIAICPEAEAGFGTPRPPMHLRMVNDEIRLIQNDDPSIDKTERLNHFIQQKIPQLSDIDAYIFKKNSPSCGVFKLKIVTESETMQMDGQGLFAAEFTSQYPQIPVEDEEGIADTGRRAKFLEKAIHLHSRQQN